MELDFAGYFFSANGLKLIVGSNFAPPNEEKNAGIKRAGSLNRSLANFAQLSLELLGLGFALAYLPHHRAFCGSQLTAKFGQSLLRSSGHHLALQDGEVSLNLGAFRSQLIHHLAYGGK